MEAFHQQNPGTSAADQLVEEQRLRVWLKRLAVQRQLPLDERRRFDRAIEEEWIRRQKTAKR